MRVLSVAKQWVVVFLGTGALLSCKTEQLSNGGAKVALSQSAPIDSGFDPKKCKSLGVVVGRGGGSFGGAWISNEELINYAMNDLRNKAAAMGANFIQHDSPTMGVAGSDGGTATTTATVSGSAYQCEENSAPPTKSASNPIAANVEESENKTVCVPGATQTCVGPGGCSGGQYCLDDGAKFSKCDCGSGN